MKAAHLGTCQACSRLHKLPGGRLAKHGYEVRGRGHGGWFNGVCMGSGELPFEESTDLIERTIAWARANINSIEAQAAVAKEIDVRTSTQTFWHLYQPAMSTLTKGSVYLWQRIDLIATEWPVFFNYRVVHTSTHHEETTQRLHTHGHRDALVRQGIDGYLRHLGELAADELAYIARLQLRLRDWKPQPLAPITGSKA